MPDAPSAAAPPPAPRAPAYNPLAAARAAGPLPAGVRATLLLGESSRSALGRRVVTGDVVGVAERGDGVDVQLRGITTWLYAAPPADLEVLPVAFSAIFRVRGQGTAAALLRRLGEADAHGRSPLTALEVPYRSCWRCRARVDEGATFCGECGWRVRVGPARGRATTPPAGVLADADAGAAAQACALACPACWSATPGAGRYCQDCGDERGWSASASSQVAGKVVRLALHVSGQRSARIRATVRDVRWVRHTAAGWPQLVLGIDTITVERPAPHAPQRGPGEVAPAWRARVVLSVDDDDREGALEALTAGEVMRASELRGPCPACAEHAAHAAARGGDAPTPPTAHGYYCPRCGARARIAPDPAWRQGWGGPSGGSKQRHRCGTAYRVGRDGFCTGCGQSLDGYAPNQGRFARLE